MLVLTLYPGGDDTFRIGDTQVKLMDITHEKRFKLRVIGVAMDSDYWITDKNATQIAPNVKVSAGHKASPGSVKVAIDAPLNIRIDREKVYQDKKRASSKK